MTVTLLWSNFSDDIFANNNWSCLLISEIHWRVQSTAARQSGSLARWTIPVFAFAAIADTHLPTPEGWKAELACVAGYVVRQFICPTAVTHPNTNRAQCSATALIETDALLLH